MEKQLTNLAPQLRQGGEMLLRLPGLPAKLKRDLRDLLNFPTKKSASLSDQTTRLLGLYERSIKIMASNPHMSEFERSNSTEQDLLAQLSSELQTLITELDFEGEYGERLYDIRAKLLIGVNGQELLDLTLNVLELVVHGTEHERKASEKFLHDLSNSVSTQLKASSQNVTQSKNNSENRGEMYQDLSKLLSRSQDILNRNDDLESMKSRLNPVFSELALIIERLEDAESREKTLIERMEFQKSQIKTLRDSTHDYRHRLEEQTARLQQDPLTKTYNRNAFYNKLEHEYHRWIKNQLPLRIVLFDIDNFKHLNDQFGFTAGDKALKIIARTIHSHIPSNTVLARFAGEEFIIMFPDCDNDSTFKAVEQIKTKVSQLPFKFRNKSIQITLSAASTEFIESDTPEEVLDRIRHYLNEAKESGSSQFLWK
ncbi:GGDEF domain-containing protein [Vibrio salinus]|uniref:GGDEF domain-containing protein n=1 Tax=Vibrio salinus TaxID=2899784 RepID=UPI001E49D7D2|nr:GGDEF domain-containing protein [Vibrio salinus]MCE0493046.1 GGDEF domain-containing protein [Vibrio salinus]